MHTVISRESRDSKSLVRPFLLSFFSILTETNITAPTPRGISKIMASAMEKGKREVIFAVMNLIPDEKYRAQNSAKGVESLDVI